MMTCLENTINFTYDDLKEHLSFIDDWEERYSYIIELGKKLPAYPDAHKNNNFLVKGCVSQVWLYPKIHADKFFFFGASDSQLVQGLIAIILIIYNGHTKSEINNIDFQAYFNTLDLSEQLTPQRSNGVFSMIKKIHEYTAQPS